MKRIILTNLVALLAVVSATAGNFMMYIKDFAIAASETRSIYVMFDNDEAIYSLQFDLQLPEGLEVTDDDWATYPDVFETDRVPTGPRGRAIWDTNSAFQNDDKSHIRVTFTNQYNSELPVGMGALFEIVVRASADFAGPVTGTISRIVVTSVVDPSVSIKPADTSFDACVSVPLADIVTSGEDDTKYFISNAVAVVDYSVENGFAIVTDGSNNWMRVEAASDVLSAIGEAGGVAASTLGGILSDAQRNQVLTLTSDPVVMTEEYPLIDVATTDLSDSFEYPANAVVTFTGYYFVENGVPTLRASVKANKETGSKGQSLTLDLSWMDGEFELVETAKYQIKGVVRLKEAWSSAPRRARSSYDYDFQNYTLSPLRSSDITVLLPTAVTDVETAKPVVSVLDGTITVDGASRVDVYSLDGRAVSATPGAGVYVVVADGVATKVVVR